MKKISWIYLSVYDPAEKYYSSNNYLTENTIQQYSCTVLNLWYRARIARLHKTTLFTPTDSGFELPSSLPTLAFKLELTTETNYLPS